MLDVAWGHQDAGRPVYIVNPDQALLRIAREEGWQVMTFDRLHRRLRIAAGAAALGAVGAGSGYVVARLRPSRHDRVRRTLRR
jgi:hypothetical protein